MTRVIIESPLAANEGRSEELHASYARMAMQDSLNRGEAPFASHLLYAQEGILNDLVPSERETGIKAGFAWMDKADLVAVYLDYGLSAGMVRGIQRAKRRGIKVEERRILL